MYVWTGEKIHTDSTIYCIFHLVEDQMKHTVDLG